MVKKAIFADLNAGTIAARSQRIIDADDPINPRDGATKNYVDGYIDLNNEWSEVLANGNTSGATNPEISAGQRLQGENGNDLNLYSSGSGDIVLNADSSDGYVILQADSTEIVRFGIGSSLMRFGGSTNAVIDFPSVSSGDGSPITIRGQDTTDSDSFQYGGNVVLDGGSNYEGTTNGDVVISHGGNAAVTFSGTSEGHIDWASDASPRLAQDQITGNGVAFNILAADATGIGSNVTINAGDSVTSGVGGSVLVTAGDAANSSVGGDVRLATGSGAGGLSDGTIRFAIAGTDTARIRDDGYFEFRKGVSTPVITQEIQTSGDGGPFYIRGQESESGNGGDLEIAAGSGGSSGDLSLLTPDATLTGSTGSISMVTGQMTNAGGATGSVAIGTGIGVSGGSGSVGITTGLATGGTTGNISLTTGGNSTVVGEINLTGGVCSGSGPAGDINLTAGNNTSTGDAGEINVTSGNSGDASKSGGGVFFTTGNGFGASPAGVFRVTGGTPTTTGQGGAIELLGGDNTSGSGGPISVLAGDGGPGGGGLVAITGGASNSSAEAGTVTITGGSNSSTGNGGNVVVVSGPSSSGTDGDVIIKQDTTEISRFDTTSGQARLLFPHSEIEGASQSVYIEHADRDTDGVGGTFYISAQAGQGVGYTNGTLHLRGGEGGVGNGGAAKLYGGYGGPSGGGGDATVSGGNGTDGYDGGNAFVLGGPTAGTGDAGDVTIEAGDNTAGTGDGGTVYVTAGTSTAGLDGYIIFNRGGAEVARWDNGGSERLLTQTEVIEFDSSLASVKIFQGDQTASEASADFTIQAQKPKYGYGGGDLILATPTHDSGGGGQAGEVKFQVDGIDHCKCDSAGYIEFSGEFGQSGIITASAAGTGGNFFVYGQGSTDDDGGQLLVRSGNGAAGFTGGRIEILTGRGGLTDGNSGKLELKTGAAGTTTGNGGDVEIAAANGGGTTGTGGDVTISGGDSFEGGTAGGSVSLDAGTGPTKGTLNFRINGSNAMRVLSDRVVNFTNITPTSTPSSNTFSIFSNSGVPTVMMDADNTNYKVMVGFQDGYTIDLGSIAAHTTVTFDDATITGAAVGEHVIVTAPDLDDGLIATGYVSAADTVTVKVTNTTAGAIDPASQEFLITVLHA